MTTAAENASLPYTAHSSPVANNWILLNPGHTDDPREHPQAGQKYPSPAIQTAVRIRTSGMTAIVSGG
jgi:hypothetical protein